MPSDTPDSGDQHTGINELPSWVIWWDRLKEGVAWTAALTFLAMLLSLLGFFAFGVLKIIQDVAAEAGYQMPLWMVATITIGGLVVGLGVLAIDFLADVKKAEVNSDGR